MDPTVITVRGTLKADGTLLLAQPSGLPPGPLAVTVKVVPAPPQSNLARLGLSVAADDTTAQAGEND